MSSRPPILPPGEVLPPMTHDAARRDDASKPKRKPKHRDRFGALNGFVDCTMADLTRAELATWLVLWRDTRDGTARTSAADIARRIGASERAVLTALGKLRRRGLLTRVCKGGLNRGPSTYRVHPLAREPT